MNIYSKNKKKNIDIYYIYVLLLKNLKINNQVEIQISD